jgi:predicted amidophosphoribosyltransferase
MTAAPRFAPPPGLASCRAVLPYDADVGRAITGLKNGDRRGRVTPLADALAALVPDLDGLVVTWAPTSDARRRERGFDQAELLARAVARRRGLPVMALLRRRPGPAQAGRGVGDRWAHPGFVARRRWSGPVLLLDDVATTGATLSAAAGALRAAGVPAVHGLVVAKAPARAPQPAAV